MAQNNATLATATSLEDKLRSFNHDQWDDLRERLIAAIQVNMVDIVDEIMQTIVKENP